MVLERPDYEEWSDADLADELDATEELIDECHRRIVSAKKALTVFTDKREDLLDVIKQRSQQKGWKK